MNSKISVKGKGVDGNMFGSGVTFGGCFDKGLNFAALDLGFSCRFFSFTFPCKLIGPNNRVLGYLLRELNDTVCVILQNGIVLSLVKCSQKISY